MSCLLHLLSKSRFNPSRFLYDFVRSHLFFFSILEFLHPISVHRSFSKFLPLFPYRAFWSSTGGWLMFCRFLTLRFSNLNSQSFTTNYSQVDSANRSQHKLPSYIRYENRFFGLPVAESFGFINFPQVISDGK